MDHKDHRITEQTIAKFHETFGYHDNVRCNLVNELLVPERPRRLPGESTKSDVCLTPVSYLL